MFEFMMKFAKKSKPQAAVAANNEPHVPQEKHAGNGIAPTQTASRRILRKLMPLAAFAVTFSVVMSALILYMNYTAQRHYKFRKDMSQDYELLSIAQDNAQLVTYIREVILLPAIEPHHKPLEYHETGPPEDTAFVLELLKNKTNGFFVESGAYGNNGSKTEWLERTLNWRGLLVQSDTRHFFTLRRHNRVRSRAVHACLSSNPYFKEITFHQSEEREVRVDRLNGNGAVADDADWFATRIKCFPLFSLLLAAEATHVDYLSLECSGTELQVLETVPFERVFIDVISVHLLDSYVEKDTITEFLSTKNYTLMRDFDTTHVYRLKRRRD